MRMIGFVILLLAGAILRGQVVINEVLYNPNPGEEQLVELKNLGGSPADLSGYWICNFPDYRQLGPGRIIPAGGIVVVHLITGEDTDTDWYVQGLLLTLGLGLGEVGLYLDSNFGLSTSMISYVQYGGVAGGRASVAVVAGLWDAASSFVPVVVRGNSIEFSGFVPPYSPGDWMDQPNPTIGSENGCDPNRGYSLDLLEQWLTLSFDPCLDLDGNDIFEITDLAALVNVATPD